MVKKLFIVGLILLIPGIWTLFQALSIGPASWALDQSLFWGTPIVNFVFWIGLAHAGTFLSAILLILEVRFQKRISLVAELSTIAAILVASIFPLIHLGIVSRFYFLIPFFDERNIFANFSSPLIWDFVAIFVYLCISIFYIVTHLLSLKHASLLKTGKVLAWILFPLVLWVHTIVSLDFAVTTNNLWQGAYFPIYFILGALFSGLALVVFLLEVQKRRVRKIEELLIAASWLLFVFWIWEFFQKGVWHFEVVFFGFVIVQLLWIPVLRNQKTIRLFVSFAALISMWLERYVLIVPSDLEWLPVDYGWFALGIGLFLSVFFGLYLLIQKYNPLVFYVSAEESNEKYSRKVLWGILAGAVVFALLYFALNYPLDTSVPLMNWIPVLFPLFSLFAGLSFFALGVYSVVPKKQFFLVSGLLVLILGGAFGAFYAGGDTNLGVESKIISVERVSKNNRPVKDLWASRCASCHGLKGEGNRKFIYEFYPEIQDLTLERLNSQGEDSLTQVVLKGRAFMNPFEGRVSESEARALIRYMYQLAEEKE